MRTLLDVPYSERELRMVSYYARLRERERVLRIPRNMHPLPRIRVEGTSWRCRVCGRAKHTLVAWQEGTQAPREPFWDRFSMLSDVCPRCRDWLNTA